MVYNSQRFARAFAVFLTLALCIKCGDMGAQELGQLNREKYSEPEISASLSLDESQKAGSIVLTINMPGFTLEEIGQKPVQTPIKSQLSLGGKKGSHIEVVSSRTTSRLISVEGVRYQNKKAVSVAGKASVDKYEWTAKIRSDRKIDVADDVVITFSGIFQSDIVAIPVSNKRIPVRISR